MIAPPASGDGSTPVPVGIILYVNRSGSTLLSRIIADALEDVFVFPELRFTLDLLVARRDGRLVTEKALLRLMREDARLATLGLAEAQITAAVARHGADDLHGLLTALATAASGRRPAAMILKLEPYVAFIPELDAAFGVPLLIHALRDPRAVARSMRATPVPEKPGFDMARGSILYAARHWRDHARRVEAIATSRPILTARYEALGGPAPAVVAEIGRALGVAPSQGTHGRYAVAPIDAALHRNIDAPFDPARDAAWHTDLTPPEIALVEALCRAEMARVGYPATTAPLGRVAFLAARLRHGRAMARHALRTAARYARRPGALRQAIARLRLARSMGEL